MSKDLGLAQEGKTVYIQCLDPCEITGVGTVVFTIIPHKEDQHEDS